MKKPALGFMVLLIACSVYAGEEQKGYVITSDMDFISKLESMSVIQRLLKNCFMLIL